MRILITPDSFKGSLSAQEVCAHLKSGMELADPALEVKSVPLADGGEGTVEAILHTLGGEWMEAEVHDPLLRPVIARYGIIPDQKMAVIEMAAASGLELLTDEERNPLAASTFGTGELILHALDQGCRSIIIGIGGSATNDGGVGMLQALGAKITYHPDRIYDGPLAGISSLDLSQMEPRLNEVKVEIASDVTNPLTGEKGATHVFGEQKGATLEMRSVLEENMIRYGALLEEAVQKPIVNVPGAGAAGGLGAGLLAFPQSRIRSGFDIVAEAVHLEEFVNEADWIITGEGKVDEQTLYGKVPYGVARIAKTYHKPVICVAGTVGKGAVTLLDHGISAVFSILQKPSSLEEAMQEAPYLLQNLGRQLIRLIHTAGGKGT